jgi:hypothetical protein
MTERITLEVSDATVQRAREAARQTNRPVEAVLAEWLERASATADILPLDTNATYAIHTPFGAEATAQSLLEIQRAEDLSRKFGEEATRLGITEEQLLEHLQETQNEVYQEKYGRSSKS